MSKICPNCQKVFDDEQAFCSQCGTRLVNQPEKPNPVLHLGDANAISGGININQSKNITSHDVHYHTTQERTKTDKELEQERRSQYREAVAKLMQNGTVTYEARAQLEDLKVRLGIDSGTAMQIENAVKGEQTVKTPGSALSVIAKLALNNAIMAVETNHPQASSHIRKLGPVCKTTENEQVQYYYYLLLAAFEPKQCIEAYERRMVDSYWQSFWTSLAYRKEGKEMEAEALLNEMPGQWPDRPEANVLVNACVGLFLESRGNLDQCRDTIVDYLNQCDSEPSELLSDLFHALLHRVGMDEDSNSRFAFYEDCFLTQAQKRSPECEAEMKEAKIADNQADFETALRIWRKWAEKEDTEAMREMAICYDGGYGVEKDDQKALEWYRKAADLGDAEAIYCVGLYYHWHVYDYEEALEWYKKAAALGHAEAMLKIGQLYSDGDGVEQNYEESARWRREYFKTSVKAGDYTTEVNIIGCEGTELFEWCRSAAAKNNTAAMMHLGDYYEYESDDEEDDEDAYLKKADYKEALKWYQKAAESGFGDAMWKMAQIYSGQWEAYKNLDEALRWCHKTAESGVTLAMRAMGDYCWEGLDGLENLQDKELKDAERSIQATSRDLGLGSMSDPRGDRFKETVSWYRKAAELGDAEAILDLAEKYYDAFQFAGLPQYRDECKKWYGRAAAFHDTVGEVRYYCVTHSVPTNLYYTFYGAEHGNPEKQKELGDLYYKGNGVAKDYTEAEKWYRLSAEQGYAPGQFGMGLCNEAKNDAESVKWFRLAAEQGYAPGQYRLAHCYEWGIGVTRSDTEAYKWYKKAADQGNDASKSIVNSIKFKTIQKHL